MQHELQVLALEEQCAKRGHLPASFARHTGSLQGWIAKSLISCTTMLQDTELKQALEAVQQRLEALDVEDLDAEREQLALAEHIVEKLTSNENQEQDASGAAVDLGTAAALVTQQTAQVAEQKPVAMLGPP